MNLGTSDSSLGAIYLGAIVGGVSVAIIVTADYLIVAQSDVSSVRAQSDVGIVQARPDTGSVEG